ncbi:MAG: transposase [Rikenellaceae bacterium]
MPLHKSTQFLSDIATFFKQNDATRAFSALARLLCTLRISDKTLFGTTTKPNAKHSFCEILQTLLLFPCCAIRNPYHYENSPLFARVNYHKDAFYRFMENAQINWRKILYHLTLQLWRKIEVRSDHRNSGEVCLIVDDTDQPKRGFCIENIGRVHSHLEHKSILGFKALVVAITDGASQMLLDFALVGEKGKRGDYGLSEKKREARFSKLRDADCALNERVNELSTSKIELMKSMIARAIKRGVKFRYVLADSWFACADIIKFIKRRHVNCDYLGMIKVGENGRTKYRFEGRDMTAPALIKLLLKRGEKRRSRKLKCDYIEAEVEFAGHRVKLFFVRRSKRGKWCGLITTDLKLAFFDAYRIYSQRWAIEVIFKEMKGLLGFGKCQARNFASQIAHSSIVMLQYNLLSTVKRFEAYETLGKLFEAVVSESIELTLSERIWSALRGVVAALAETFGLTDEEVFEGLSATVSFDLNVLLAYDYKAA